MAEPVSTAMDAMTQMVMAGEGGLMAAVVTFENDVNLATALAAASVPQVGTPMVRTRRQRQQHEEAGIRQDESILQVTPMNISLGESRQGEPMDVGRLGEGQLTLPPQPSKRPFESPLYRRGYRIDTASDISMELGSTQKIVVQVNDQTLNAWARSLVRKPDGHIYFVSPNRTRWFQGVNTWLAVDTVQKYMRDCSTFPRNPQQLQPLSTPRFRSVMDYVATLRAAASSPAAAFWWFNHSLRSQLVVSCALHYMSPWQCFFDYDCTATAAVGDRRLARTPAGGRAGVRRTN